MSDEIYISSCGINFLYLQPVKIPAPSEAIGFFGISMNLDNVCPHFYVFVDERKMAPYIPDDLGIKKIWVLNA